MGPISPVLMYGCVYSECLVAHSAHEEQTPMLDVTAAEKPTAPKSITIKHLANELGEQHQLSKRQALKLMEDLISMVAERTLTHAHRGISFLNLQTPSVQ